MPRGYLANVLNIPPLIFRFQYNPDFLQEKKSYKYKESNSFGQWTFDRAQAGAGAIGTLSGLYDDVKEIGSLLVATKPLEPEEGDQRTFSLDFVLDASVPGPEDGGDHFGGSIEPDLAVLRSFVNPSWDLIDVIKMIGKKEVACFSKPPECSLFYGGISSTCVMTDLNIKMVSFFPTESDSAGKPLRAEVSVTLKEQSFSVTPIVDLGKRLIGVARSYGRPTIGEDFLATTPILNLFF